MKPACSPKDIFLCLESSAQQVMVKVLTPDVESLLPCCLQGLLEPTRQVPSPTPGVGGRQACKNRVKAHLAEDDGGIGAVTLHLFPALQHNN